MSLTLVIIVFTCFLSYQAFTNGEMFYKLKHYPIQEFQHKEYYRLISSGFIHGSWMHLLVNMYVLYTFGETVEHRFEDLFRGFGKVAFILFYMLAIVFANLPTFLRQRDNGSFASIGASGAISAVVFVFIALYPWSQLSLLILPFLPFPAIAGGIAYLIYSSWASKNRQDHIDHSAHFAGAIFGIAFLFIAKPELLPLFIAQIREGIGM